MEESGREWEILEERVEFGFFDFWIEKMDEKNGIRIMLNSIKTKERKKTGGGNRMLKEKTQEREYFLQDLQSQVNVVLKYNQNQVDQAKKVLNGSLKDMYVLKGKINGESQEVYGLCIYYISTGLKKLVGIKICVSNNIYIYKHKIYDSWIFFESMIQKDFQDSSKQEESYRMQSEWVNYLTGKKIERILELITEGRFNVLEDFFRSHWCKILGLKAEYQMEIEMTSSLLFEKNSQSKLMDIWQEEDLKEEGKEEVSRFEEYESRFEKKRKEKYEGKTMLEGDLILSSQSGKLVRDLRMGDWIEILIRANSEVAIGVGERLNLYEEETMKATLGKVNWYYRQKNQYEIFVEVAKDTFVHIQEKDDVLISTDQSYPNWKKRTGAGRKGNKGLILGILFLCIILGILGMMIFFEKI